MKKTKLVFISILLIGITGAITAQELNEKYMFSKNGSMVTKWVYRGIDTTIHSFPDIEIEITKKFWSKDHVYGISPEIIGKISLDTVKYLLAKKIPQKIARDSIRTSALSYLFGNNSYRVRYFVVQKEMIKSASEVKKQEPPILTILFTLFSIVFASFMFFNLFGGKTRKESYWIIILIYCFILFFAYWIFLASSKFFTFLDLIVIYLPIYLLLALFVHLLYKKEQKKQKLEDSKNYDAIDAATLGSGKNEDFVGGIVNL